MLEVNHISFSSSEGGAAIAAHRLHMALNASGVNSIMTVARGQEGPGITTFKPAKGLGRMIQREMARSIRRWHEADFSGLISLGQVRSGLAQYLNQQPSQILNLHWVNSDLMSIREIGNLSHPVVWTMHDMWPLCGVEHYSEGDAWKNGYATQQDSRASRLNRRVWKTKQRFWTRPFHLVAPSRWLADCARQSALNSGLARLCHSQRNRHRRLAPHRPRRGQRPIGSATRLCCHRFWGHGGRQRSPQRISAPQGSFVDSETGKI